MLSLFNDIPRLALFTFIDICSVGHRANPAAARSAELSPGSRTHGEIHHPHKCGRHRYQVPEYRPVACI